MNDEARESASVEVRLALAGNSPGLLRRGSPVVVAGGAS
jgi:hypothetical protein